MSERFHKTFISPREFVESWDREIYELRNLDYFIYLMINHLGNRLEKNYFIRDRKDSNLSLSFENLATLCFNIGDSFEYFLEGEGSRREAENTDFFDLEAESRKRHNHKLEERIRTLKSILAEGIVQEQSFRIDLMEHVVLDSLLQFYLEEMNLEIGEDDLEIVELADFIEEAMVSFIRNEGQELLQRPADPAIDYFEDLLGLDEEYREDKKWHQDEEAAPEDSVWEGTGYYDFESLPQVIDRFKVELNGKENPPSPTAVQDINLFAAFLRDEADVHNLYDLSEEHLQEFMSIWLLRHFAQKKLPRFSHIFQTLARFLGWLNQQYQMDLKREFARYYDRIKIEVPRIARVMNSYLESYDMFRVMLLRDQPDSHQTTDYFEVKGLSNRRPKIVSLHNFPTADAPFEGEVLDCAFDSPIFSRIKPGDIMHATLVEGETGWNVLEIHFLYPAAAKPFLK